MKKIVQLTLLASIFNIYHVGAAEASSEPRSVILDNFENKSVENQIVLYYFPSCPFCQKVLNFMEENNITIPMKNIQTDPEAKKELISIGGAAQVPCLIIDGEALYESDYIIEELTHRYLEESSPIFNPNP